MKKILIICLFVITGCVGDPFRMKTPEPGSYDIIGEAEGRSSGVILFDLIPINMKGRFHKAYDRAVDSKNGDALVDVKIGHRWCLAVFLTCHITNMSGKVIKFKDGPKYLEDATTKTKGYIED